MSRAWLRLLSLCCVLGIFACDSGGNSAGDGGSSDGGASLGEDGSAPAELDGGDPGGAGRGGTGGGSSGSSGGATDAGTSPGTDAGSTPTPGAPVPVLELADLPDYSTEDNDAFLNGVVGTYPVAIYRVPQGNEAWIGKAELTVEHSGDGFKAELVAENGDSVSKVDSTDPMNANSLLTPIIGQVFVFRESTIAGYLNISFSATGYIFGAAGGAAEVAFRNDIVAYGKAVPPIFGQLEGSYEGVAQALTCEQPPVSMTVDADGTVSLTGQYNLSCEEGTVSATWDGNDDYVVATPPMGYELAIDSQKGGGSNAGGGVRMRFDTLEAGAVITSASASGAGAVGNIESNSLIQEGELPTQAQFTLRMIQGMTVDVTASGDDMPPWDMDTDSFSIGDDGKLMFAGQTFTFSNAVDTQGTTDQKTFTWQTIYMTFNLINVSLTYKTDKTFVSGTYGAGGTLEPR